jgi:hypothetical protein
VHEAASVILSAAIIFAGILVVSPLSAAVLKGAFSDYNDDRYNNNITASSI